MIEAILNKAIGFNIHSVGRRKVDADVVRRMRHCGVATEEAYLELLRHSPEEMAKLIETVTIPETWFFRLCGSFEYLAAYVREEWLPQRKKPLRVLCMPCSTGEEAYSIAMILMECGLSGNDFLIDAGDINNHYLDKARKAVYSKNSFRGERPDLVNRYFRPAGNLQSLIAEVKEKVRFFSCNVLDFVPPAVPYDIVFCRNMLIYLDAESQKKTLELLAASLADNGVFFLGHSESGLLFNTGFVPVKISGSFAFRKGAEPSRREAVRPKRSCPRQETILPKVRKDMLPVPRENRSLALNEEDIFAQAERLADLGDSAAAEVLCRRHLALHPLDIRTVFLLGIIMQSTGKYEEAEKLFLRTLYLDANHHEALLSMAILKGRSGDLKSAAAFRERADRTVKGTKP